MMNSMPTKPAVRKFTKSLIGKWLKVGWVDDQPTIGIGISCFGAPGFGVLVVDGLNTKIIQIDTAEQIIQVGPMADLEIPQEML